ncbi:FAD assembly factor SdhE [Neoroseomonas soli]|nr:succinate dehydrogenase assembly factor 2 [Neoroseomonas soli]
MPDTPDLDSRRRRLVFRALHRGTKEADLMIGGFVTRNIAAFSEAELDEIEAVLEHWDVDLADWLSGRRPIPPEADTPMLRRMAAECGQKGFGVPPGAER